MHTRLLIISLVALNCVLGRLSAAPYGDDFYSPNYLFGDTDSDDDTTVGATYQAGEPTFYSEGGSVWFKWTAWEKGLAIFDATFGTQQLPKRNLLDVYTGDSIQSLVRLGSDDRNYRARVTIATSAFTTYYARITTYYASRVGPVNLAVSFARDNSDDPVYGHFTKFPSFLPMRRSVARGYFTDPERIDHLNCHYSGRLKIDKFAFDHNTGAFSIVFTKKHRSKRTVRGKAIIQAFSYNGVMIGDTIDFTVRLR